MDRRAGGVVCNCNCNNNSALPARDYHKRPLYRYRRRWEFTSRSRKLQYSRKPKSKPPTACEKGRRTAELNTAQSRQRLPGYGNRKTRNPFPHEQRENQMTARRLLRLFSASHRICRGCPCRFEQLSVRCFGSAPEEDLLGYAYRASSSGSARVTRCSVRVRARLPSLRAHKSVCSFVFPLCLVRGSVSSTVECLDGFPPPSRLVEDDVVRRLGEPLVSPTVSTSRS